MRRAVCPPAWVPVVALVLAACTTSPQAPPSASPTPPATSATAAPTPTPTTTPSPSPSDTAAADGADARIAPVGEAQWARIRAAGMARTGCPVTRTDLRRVEINHWGFDGAVHRGVLVVNADVASSVARIFTELYDARFPIRRMKPLEEYGGDNEKSMADDNTAAYNCRSATQQNSPPLKSPHANGRAVDVNPFENPWQDPRCAPCWSPSDRYGTVREGKGVIVEGGVAWSAFTSEGWIWQDIDVKDYMHFDTGYPSKPFTGSSRP